MAKVELSKPKQVKIGSKIVDCLFIRYANNNGTYQFRVHISMISDIVIELKNVIFFEDIFPCKERKEIISNKKTYKTTNDYY